MNAYSLSFQLGTRHYCFIPNTNFWILLLVAFLGLSHQAFQLGQEHLEMRTRLSGEAPSWANTATHEFYELNASDERPPMELGLSVMAMLTALVNAILKRLISYFIKLNNVMLLAQRKMDEVNQRPLALKMGGHTVQFQPTRYFWGVVAGAFLLPIGIAVYFHMANAEMRDQITALQRAALMGEDVSNIEEVMEKAGYRNDVVGYFLDYFREYEKNQQDLAQDYRDAFLIQKHLLMTKYLIESKVSRADQLPPEKLAEMHQRMVQLFKDMIIEKITIEPHVYKYFTDDSDLNKLETALMEQAKYHVPASITLAQSALETAYGARVIHNNYFGIKDKNSSSGYTETTEYYNAKEVALNKSKILSKEKVVKGGKTLYRCRIRDSFVKYSTPWASFRGHSIFLASSPRYSPLFTGGKNYEAWADRIGSTKYGGVGYATSPIYGELLKKIIKRYNLDLLDY